MLTVHVIHRQLEHAWLDFGLLDKNQLLQLGKDLSEPSKMVLYANSIICSLVGAFFCLLSLVTFPLAQVDAHERFVKFSKALGEPYLFPPGKRGHLLICACARCDAQGSCVSTA